MRTSHSNDKLIVITSGDPSGIGPEIILKALAQRKLTQKFNPLVIGDYEVFRRHAAAAGLRLERSTAECLSLSRLAGRDINFIDAGNIRMRDFRYGCVKAEYGKASMEYLGTALAIVRERKGCALVTAPINKESIRKAGYDFPGHTEFLMKETASPHVTMMLASKPIKTSLVTRHVALADVPKYLTERRIIDTVTDTHYALSKLFKIKNPRIGVAALNPHAGEAGAFGEEEKKVIRPAIAKLKKKISRDMRAVAGRHPFPQGLPRRA